MARVNPGVSYPLTVITHSYSEAVKVYIDWNADGIFSVPSEETFADNGTSGGIHNGNIAVPASASRNKVLRMRVLDESYFSGSTYIPINPCGNRLYGQAEDYGIYVMDD